MIFSSISGRHRHDQIVDALVRQEPAGIYHRTDPGALLAPGENFCRIDPAQDYVRRRLAPVAEIAVRLYSLRCRWPSNHRSVER